MSVIRKKHATYDDIVALPENLVGEIIDGDLFASPRPAPRHANAAGRVGGQLDGFSGRSGGPGGPGGWWILPEPELRFRRDILVPDLAGWRRERMPTLPASAAIELAPDWVCEVLSPSTERLDRSRKLRVYAREGVEHVWFVNPLERMLEVMRRDGKKWRLEDVHIGDVKLRLEPFAEIELDLSRWWPEPEGG